MYDPEYQSYGILAVSPSDRMAALGNINGNVKVLKLGKSVLWLLVIVTNISVCLFSS